MSCSNLGQLESLTFTGKQKILDSFFASSIKTCIGDFCVCFSGWARLVRVQSVRHEREHGHMGATYLATTRKTLLEFVPMFFGQAWDGNDGCIFD